MRILLYSSEMMDVIDDDKNNNNARTLPKTGQLLIQRYKVNDHSLFNNYASFCNAAQIPGFVNINAKDCVLGMDPPRLRRHWRPSLYDYFGFSMKNLQEVTTDKFSRDNNFDLLPPLITDSSDQGAIFEERKPSFFFIKSTLMIESQEDKLDGRRVASWSEVEHFVPVIYKSNHYYICPGGEKALIYRVLHPKKLFFTEKGQRIIAALLVKSFSPSYHVSGIRLILPKHFAQINEVSNWDGISVYEIKVQIPFPVVTTHIVPDQCHSSVQVVALDYGNNIIDVQMEEDDFGDDSTV